jgi:salicylate hydroxylase
LTLFITMPPPRVVIIGCGIAGPVIALLLKKKGYDPIVLEKVRKLGDAGGSLMMMPNGYVLCSSILKKTAMEEETPFAQHTNMI